LGSQFCEVNFFRSDVLRKFTYPAFKVARRVTGPTRFSMASASTTTCAQITRWKDTFIGASAAQATIGQGSWIGTPQ
jgi:hypothetical protein